VTSDYVGKRQIIRDMTYGGSQTKVNWTRLNEVHWKLQNICDC